LLQKARQGIATILLAPGEGSQSPHDNLYAFTLPAGTRICRLTGVLWNTLFPNVGGVAASTVTLVKAVQSRNASLSILVTLLGMITLANPVQPQNAEFWIVVTLLGMVTLVKLVFCLIQKSI
jgi:hypothetical protein